MNAIPNKLHIVVNSGVDPKLRSNLGAIVRVLYVTGAGNYVRCVPVSRLRVNVGDNSYMTCEPNQGVSVLFEDYQLRPLTTEEESIALDETILWAGFPGRSSNSTLLGFHFQGGYVNPLLDNAGYNASFKKISDILGEAIDRLIRNDPGAAKFLKPRNPEN